MLPFFKHTEEDTRRQKELFEKAKPNSDLYTYWLGNCVSNAVLLKPFQQYFPKIYFHLLWRDGRRWAVAFGDTRAKYKNTVSDVARLLRKQGDLLLSPSYANKRPEVLLSWNNGKPAINGDGLEKKDFLETLRRLEYDAVITERIEYAETIELIVINKHGKQGQQCQVTDALIASTTEDTQHPLRIDVAKGTYITENGLLARRNQVPNWKDICNLACKMTQYLAVYEILKYRVALTNAGFKFLRVYSSFNYDPAIRWSDALHAFLSESNHRRENPTTERAKINAEQKRRQAEWEDKIAPRHWPGFREYLARAWEEDLAKDEADERTSPAEKRWCYERGFFSYRIQEIGLTEENWQNYVSDYEYHFVNKINSDYDIWIGNKLSSYFIQEDMKDHRIEHYYLVKNINGSRYIAPLHDLPAHYENTTDAILDLAKRRGVLAIKRAYATHGAGFCKLAYEDGTFWLNGEVIAPEDFSNVFFDDECLYLVTEYVEAHPFLRSVYPDSLNTVRVGVINRLHSDPVIGACFAKFGHSNGGSTDNINTAAGGICVSLDKQSGTIIKPEFKRGNWYEPCEVHPDTGVRISGTLPHWEAVIEGVKDFARRFPQIEYMGFDVAITEESFKIVEVNVFPDYTKYLLFDAETQDFLRAKVNAKRRSRGVDPNEKSWPTFTK